MLSPTRFEPRSATAELDALRPALRLAVHELRRRHRGRAFPWLLNLGSLDGAQVSFTVADPSHADAGLRIDASLALLARCSQSYPTIWITRCGDTETTASDLAWLQSCWGACRDLGRAPGAFLVLTKDGWTAPFVDESARWKRLRIRPRPAQLSQACTGSLECISSR